MPSVRFKISMHKVVAALGLLAVLAGLFFAYLALDVGISSVCSTGPQ